jgi:hypothetical protein
MIGEAFHNHLDSCAQCEQHPFDLCAIGARLLRETATGSGRLPEQQIPPHQPTPEPMRGDLPTEDKQERTT